MTQRTNASQNDPSASGFDRLLILIGIIGVLVSILAVVVVVRGGDTAGAAGAEGEVQLQDAFFELTEFAIDGDLEIGAGPTRFQVDNTGAVIHNLVFEGGPATPDLASGESAVLEFENLTPGTYDIFCSIAGHREAGMEARLVVTEGGAAIGDGAHAAEEVDWEELDRAMEESILAFPAETEGKGNQALEPTVLDDGTKEFRLTTAITPWEVEPGKIVDAWTYNGQVPGPEIRVDLGDKVRVIVDNQLPMGTDVHWHGVRTPNAMDGVAPITQELIRSGETFVYEFVADEPAIGMYHAHHHGQMQIPNGLF